jgi:hypothetical protein
MSLQDQVKTVRTPEEFVRFLGELSADFEAHRDTWSNADLGAFLEGMRGWLEDMDGYYANIGENPKDLPPWRILADALMAARVYE